MISIADLKQALSEIKMTDEAREKIEDVVAEAEFGGEISQSIVLKLVKILEAEMEKDESFAEAAEKVVEEIQKAEDEIDNSIDELIEDDESENQNEEE